MLNFFLLTAAALGVVGLVSLVRAPAQMTPAGSDGPTPAPMPTSKPLTLIPKNPQPIPSAATPNPVDAFRAWFTIVRPVLLASGASTAEIRQAGLDLVKHLIMEAASDET
ncbi:hypothetical protein [Blastopirellula marina]|uniref:Uncharacterized protein n=1 Tax=Blastopirellula marina TaxID=124 RepID=A0A2S8GN50_9BACT|nr:hypothetical protein [Blastopirellula marina]PQO45848.1 hypothetical protein C5Y93_11360 [Blastopirellula marina]